MPITAPDIKMLFAKSVFFLQIDRFSQHQQVTLQPAKFCHEFPCGLQLPNVELTGAARLYRAASSDRRERG